MKLSSLISDGMILQRDTHNRIWGNCMPKSDVTLRLMENGDAIISVQTRSDENGEFEGYLSPVKAGGPYELVIETPDENLCIKDILFGDVFLLAGQSNMELPVSRTLDLTREYCKSINNDRIRQFEVPKEVDFKGPVADIYTGQWKKANQDNVYDFSALGYFFAENVYAEHNVPVGLLQTACGGIQIEALIPEEKLLKLSEKLIDEAKKRGETKEKNCICNANHSCKFCYAKVIENDKSDEYITNTMKEDEARNNEFYSWLENNDIGVKNNFKEKETLFDDGTSARYIKIPGRWEDLEAYPYLEYVRGSIFPFRMKRSPKRQDYFSEP